MNIKELKRRFPKSIEQLKQWGNQLFVKTYTSHLQNAPEELKEQIEKEDVPVMTDEVLEGFIAFYPRRLWDFFDVQGIYISIKHTSIGFSWDVNGEHEPWPNEASRIEAEERAFKKAFEILEGKL